MGARAGGKLSRRNTQRISLVALAVHYSCCSQTLHLGMIELDAPFHRSSLTPSMDSAGRQRLAGPASCRPFRWLGQLGAVQLAPADFFLLARSERRSG